MDAAGVSGHVTVPPHTIVPASLSVPLHSTTREQLNLRATF